MTIASGGVLPKIHPDLLVRKRPAKLQAPASPSPPQPVKKPRLTSPPHKPAPVPKSPVKKAPPPPSPKSPKPAAPASPKKGAVGGKGKGKALAKGGGKGAKVCNLYIINNVMFQVQYPL